MMRSEFDKIMEEIIGTGYSPKVITDEMYKNIEKLYVVCDLFESKRDIGKFIDTFGYQGVEKLLNQYERRQKEIDKLRSQNSTLVAKLCKIFNEAILNDDKSLKKMAINFFKEENLDD